MSRPRVFISYSRKDRRLEDGLADQLKVFESAGAIEVWDDRKLRPGDQWSPSIELAINKSSAAVLFISPKFLTSTYIMGNEVPHIRSRLLGGRIAVLPIL